MPPQIFLIRHGETEWSRTGQHTGRTDIPLTPNGRAAAEALSRDLQSHKFAVWTSPLIRARDTARLAGYADAQVEDDLREWDYGIYEGLTSAQIRAKSPDWSIWNSPIPNGESIEQVAGRARHVIDRVVEAGAPDVALFAHGHILRILASVWIGTPPATAGLLALDTGSISILGYEHSTRVIRRWNWTSGL